MTIEARIPLEHTKMALNCYQRLHNCVYNALYVFDYKARICRKTLISLVLSVVKVILFTVFVALIEYNANSDVLAVFVLLAVIFGVSIVLDLVYYQKVAGRRIGKLRLRFPYYISSVANDMRELGWFKKYFGIKTPVLLLVLGGGKAQAHQNIMNWGYLVGEDYCKYIDAYNEQYHNYREYVDLGQYWGCCDELIEILNSGRATSIQGALSVVDTRRHREKMEQYARETAEAARSQAEAAWEAQRTLQSIESNQKELIKTNKSIDERAKSIESTAKSMEATEKSIDYNVQRQADYLRQIRDRL